MASIMLQFTGSGRVCSNPSRAPVSLRFKTFFPAATAPRRAAFRSPRRAALRPPTIQAVAAPETEVDETLSVTELKSVLLDSLWGVDRGLSASSDARAEIDELITQLEAKNPTPQPNETPKLLNGTWRLVYTANSELLPLLGLSRLPLVNVEEITQTINGDTMSVENKVQLSGPLARTSFATSASVEVRSPKLLQVQFRQGRVATPQLLQDVALPQSLDVLGRQVDISPLQSVLQPLEGPLRGALSSLSGLLARQSDLQFPIPAPQASTWLLNTYLDEDLRITRGDGGSVYVLVKDAFADADNLTPYDSAAAAAYSAVVPEAPVAAAPAAGVAELPVVLPDAPIPAATPAAELLETPLPSVQSVVGATEPVVVAEPPTGVTTPADGAEAPILPEAPGIGPATPVAGAAEPEQPATPLVVPSAVIEESSP
ncbi:hypothetical protein N2152v2_008991 [Parachlorella kessleri]